MQDIKSQSTLSEDDSKQYLVAFKSLYVCSQPLTHLILTITLYNCWNIRYIRILELKLIHVLLKQVWNLFLPLYYDTFMINIPMCQFCE